MQTPIFPMRWVPLPVAGLFLLATSAFAGTCPPGANYINPANPGGAKVTLASMGITVCYYVANSGSNSATGADESHSWAYAPGMTGCTLVCASTAAGTYDTWGSQGSQVGIILRGGDTWTDQQMDYVWFGPSASYPNYVGVDPAWYSGSSWARPIFNDNATGDLEFEIEGDNVIFDNIEFTGLYFSNPSSPVHYIDMRTTAASTIQNCYFHGWTHGGTTDNCMLIYSNSTTGGNLVFNVFDGSDTTSGGNSCYAVYGGSGQQVAYNYVTNMPNGFVGYIQSLHDNVVNNLPLSFDSSQHQNQFENNTSPSPVYVYNNILRHGYTAGSNVTLWDAPNGAVDYIFNNVLYDTTTGNILDFAQPLSGSQGTVVFFSNTVECGPDSDPDITCASNNPAPSTWRDNHFIGPSATGSAKTYVVGSGGLVSETYDIAQTKATANGQGYTMSNGFAPTASNNSTVGAGTNLTSTCTAIGSSTTLATAAQAACKESTTLACAYSTSNHTVSCPALAAVSRPSSGAWDVGAYQYAAGSSVSPPSSLTATVQ
jgi:hypothetical protein